MASIAELLKEYSKENAVLSPDETPNLEPEDILEEAIEEVEIDEDEGAVLSEECRQVTDVIDTMFDATFSLESSVDFLEQMRNQGYVSDTSMNLFNASIVESLEARGIPAEILGDEVVFSAESASEEKAEEKKQGFFRRLWEMIKRAFQRVREWVMRFVAWFRKSGSAVKSAAQKLLTKAEEKKKEGATAEGKKFNAAAFTDLSINDKIDVKGSLKRLAEASNVVLSSALSIAHESEKISTELSSEATADGWFKRAKQAVTGVKRNYAQALQKSISLPVIKQLPGNRTLDIVVGEGKKGISVRVGVTQHLKAAKPRDAWQDVMSLDEIIATAKGIIALVETTEKGLDEYNKIVEKGGLKDLKNFKIEAHGSHEQYGASNEDVREITALIVQGNAVSQKLASNISKIIFPIAKRAYVYGAINLSKYKVAKK